MSSRKKYISLILSFIIVFTIMLLLKPRTLSEEEFHQLTPKPTTPRDFYLMYKYYFDPELQKLKQEIQEYP